MPGGIHHFAIQVRDLGGAERFYRDVLGFAVVRRWRYPAPSSTSPANPGDRPTAATSRERSLWLDLGDDAHGFLALEHIDSHPATPAEEDGGSSRPGHHLLAFRIDVSERAAWEERLGAAGVVVTHRTAYTLYFADPEGNRLGLSHYPSARAPDLPTRPEPWPK